MWYSCGTDVVPSVVLVLVLAGYLMWYLRGTCMVPAWYLHVSNEVPFVVPAFYMLVAWFQMGGRVVSHRDYSSDCSLNQPRNDIHSLKRIYIFGNPT